MRTKNKLYTLSINRIIKQLKKQNIPTSPFEPVYNNCVLTFQFRPSMCIVSRECRGDIVSLLQIFLFLIICKRETGWLFELAFLRVQDAF